MLYTPKIDDYLKILTETEKEYFVAINFSEYFKSTKETLYSKLSKDPVTKINLKELLNELKRLKFRQY